MLFYRFISENLTAYLNEAERRPATPTSTTATCRTRMPSSAARRRSRRRASTSFPRTCSRTSASGPATTRTSTRRCRARFTNIEASAVGTESEDDIKGLFDDLDVNSAKLGPTVAKRNEKLVKLLDAIGDLNFGNGGFTENTIDAFGDAYEYLMGMYASSAGKSGGEYYTPQEVSELLARITVVGKTEVNKVYDPACGSGSLLLKFAKVLPGGVRQGFFGQEINLTTYNLCRINMFLHDVNYEHFDIAHGDTLIDPAHWDDEPFEAIVSNPPYSTKWEGDANPLLINDPRYAPAGVLAPKSKADLAFTMHMLSWLAVNGTAAIVEFPGVLYRGGAEQKIRKYLVDNNYVDTVIQLPPDLFFGTTIATCIIVLKKSKTDNKVLFIDASAEFVRQGNKNKLTADHQQKILDAFTAREDVAHFATLSTTPTSRPTATTSLSAPTSRPRTPASPSTSRAQRRDRPHRRPAGRAAHRDRRHRRRPGGIEVVAVEMGIWRVERQDPDPGGVERRGPGAATGGLHRVRSHDPGSAAADPRSAGADDRWAVGPARHGLDRRCPRDRAEARQDAARRGRPGPRLRVVGCRAQPRGGPGALHASATRRSSSTRRSPTCSARRRLRTSTPSRSSPSSRLR